MAKRTIEPMMIGLICVVFAWVFLITMCALNYPDISAHLMRNTVVTSVLLVFYVGFMIYMHFQRRR